MTNSNTAIESSHLPVIAGHEIAIDEHGRFNLNAIHRASESDQSKRPGNWSRTAQAIELIDELESKCSDLSIKVIESRKGSGGGTYAHELLAISYAGWISPRFQLQVNQVFLDYRMGKLRVAESDSQKALPNPLTPDHQRGIQKAVARRAQALPKGLQRLAYSRLYSHLKDRFGVAKYDQIPDEQYTEALGAIESYTFSGDFLEAAGMQEPKPVKQIGLDEWLGMNYYIASRQMDQNRVMITARSLIDSEYRSPCMRLVKELEAEGHNLDACRLEIASLRHHLESAVRKLENIVTAAQGVNVQAVSFSR
jgi:hypothetical protein